MRHGAPAVDPDRPAAEWPLQPCAHDAVLALADRLPVHAAWFSSPEPKARATAGLLHPDVAVVPELAEHRRAATPWVEVDDWHALVRRAFARPDEPAHPGWEPLTATRDRLLPAVRRILRDHDGDVVLVGHGTAWTLLVAELTGAPPDLTAWASLRMPDVLVLPRPRT